jgi:AcrR family transcriptional regulator
MDGAERRILDAAAVVFSRYGYRQTSVGQVADEARLTRQSLYRYFENKEALFLAALHDLHAAALDRAAEAGAAAGDQGLDLAGRLSAQLMAWLDLYIERLDVSPHAGELVEEGARQFGDVTLSYNQRLADRLAETIAEVTTAGPEVAAGLANLLMAAVRGLKSTRPALPREGLRAQIEAATRLMVSGAGALGHFASPRD